MYWEPVRTTIEHPITSVSSNVVTASTLMPSEDTQPQVSVEGHAVVLEDDEKAAAQAGKRAGSEVALKRASGAHLIFRQSKSSFL